MYLDNIIPLYIHVVSKSEIQIASVAAHVVFDMVRNPKDRFSREEAHLS